MIDCMLEIDRQISDIINLAHKQDDEVALYLLLMAAFNILAHVTLMVEKKRLSTN